MSDVPEIKNLPEILKPVLGENTKIINFIAKHMVPPGENYGGIILSLDVHIENSDKSKSTMHLVAKLGPSNEMLAAMFNIQFTFKREMDTYIDIIPTLINFQKEYNIPDNKILDLFPKCYGGRLNLNCNNEILDKNGLMLFENLKTQGFTMEDRMIGFNLHDAGLFLNNLARFHALPIALKLLKPDVFKQKISVLKPASFGDSFTEELKQQFLNDLHNVVSELDGCEQYANKVKDLVDKGYKLEERFLEPEEPFSTTVHHDLWANNIMVLRDNNGKTLKIKLYDLQLLCYGSLAHDLIFFLYSSVQQDIVDKHYDDLVKLYYDSFIECLREFNLNTEQFSWDKFLAELDKIGPHQISHILIMLRPIFLEKGQIQDNGELNENEISKLHALTLNSGYKIKMRKNILSFAQKNWLL